MIKEETEDLISRKKLMEVITKKGNEEFYGATLNCNFTSYELFKLIYSLPSETEASATWIWEKDSRRWVCSNCRMSCLNNNFGAPIASRSCPYCGRRMKGEEK